MLKTVSTIRQALILLIAIAGCLQAYGYSDIAVAVSGSGSYCAGSPATLTYSAQSVVFLPGNVLRAELSDASGSFSAAVSIGTLTTEAPNGTIDVVFPVTASGTAYRIRIVSSSPNITGSDNGSNLTVRQPSLATPSVTIAGPPAICADVSIEFIASPTHGGTMPSYQWKKNGNVVGTNSPSYIDAALVSGDAIQCVMTSNRECVTSPTANSNTIPVTVVARTIPTIAIAADPSATVGAGSVIYLSAATTGGGSAPRYEWKRNGTLIGTSNAFAISTLANNDVITATLTSNEVCVQPAVAHSNELTISVDNNLTRTGHAWEPRAGQMSGADPIVRSNASGFTIGQKGFVGLGFVMVGSSIQYRKDFWEYDPDKDVWTQRADFAGDARHSAVGFNIVNKGYIGTGLTAAGVKKDFWQYDQTSNAWTQRADFPGAAREQAFGFAIGSKGYIGGGFSNGQGDFKDFYEFDPSSNTWRSRADFGGGKRMGSATFAIEGKGFAAGGYSSSSTTWFKDLWDFDQAANLWTRRADMPGNGRTRATGFSMAGNGYVGLGYSNNGYEGQFFQYLLSSDTWTWKHYYPGPGGNNSGVGLITNNRPFIYKDGTMIEFRLLTASSFSSKVCSGETIPVIWDASGFTFAPGNTMKAEISSQANFSARTGVGEVTSSASTGTINVNIPPSVPGGTYYFRIISKNPEMSTLSEQIRITELPAVHNIVSEGGATVCKDAPATFRSNLEGPGFQWYRNNNLVGDDAPSYNTKTLVNGDVIKSVRTYVEGCKDPVGLISNSIIMTVKEPVKPAVKVVPNTLTCTTAAIAYLWYLDGTPIETATRPSYIMTKAGIYKVRTTDNSGCTAFSDEIGNVYVGLADETSDEQISVYPNPAVHEFTLQLTDDLVIRHPVYSMVNELGQTIIGAQPAGKYNRISLSGRAPGLYLVRLTLNGESILRRIVKVE